MRTLSTVFYGRRERLCAILNPEIGGINVNIKYASTILYKVDLPGIPSSFLGVRIVGKNSKGFGLICFPVYSRPNGRTTLRYLDKFYTTSSLDKPMLLRKEQIVGKYSAKELAAIKVYDKKEMKPKTKRIHVELDAEYQQELAAARERDFADFYRGKYNRFERLWKRVYHGGSFSSK